MVKFVILRNFGCSILFIGVAGNAPVLAWPAFKPTRSLGGLQGRKILIFASMKAAGGQTSFCPPPFPPYRAFCQNKVAANLPL